MPVISGLTDPILIKLFREGKGDEEIAQMYGITKQAVSNRRTRLGLRRDRIARQVSEYLACRWSIKTTMGPDSHHNQWPIMRLREWARVGLGDKSLSSKQYESAVKWMEQRRDRGEVLYYDPESVKGWFYRPRTEKDERLLVDWPEDLPFPSEKFRQALEFTPVKGAS